MTVPDSGPRADGERADLRAALEVALLRVDALGAGVDLEDLARWQAMSRGMLRLFRPREVAYCQAQGTPVQHFAGTWCAKEAVVKALSGVAAVHVRDVEICRDAAGRPTATVDGLAIGADDLVISITHTATVAAAIAVHRRVGSDTDPASSTPGRR